MEISFTKKTEGKHIISCRRKDGTVTWMHGSRFFIVHDVCHYAAEKNLGLKQGFYGMLASGINISDFELPKNQRPFALTEEALFAEELVNLLYIDYTQGRVENLLQLLQVSCSPGNAFVGKLQNNMLDQIRKQISLWMTKWNGMKEEDILTLVFEE